MRMKPSSRSETVPSMQVGPPIHTAPHLHPTPLPSLTGGLLTPRGREQQAAE